MGSNVNVKYTTCNNSDISQVPVVEGQIIACRDVPQLFYDMLNQHLMIDPSSTWERYQSDGYILTIDGKVLTDKNGLYLKTIDQ